MVADGEGDYGLINKILEYCKIAFLRVVCISLIFSYWFSSFEYT